VFRKQAYYIASAAFVILLIIYFVGILNQAYVGLELKNVNGQWIVTASDPLGEGFKSGVRVGDYILKINNHDTGEYRFVQKWNETEGASSIEFRRLGQSTDNTIKISRNTVLLKLLSELPMVFLGFIFWMLGFILWLKRSFLVQARALFWLNWFIGLAIVLAPASGRDLIFARELEYIILSAVPLLLINFVSVFPSEKKNRINRFASITLIFMFAIIFGFTILQSVGMVHSISLLRKLVLSDMMIGILLALWNLCAIIKLPNDKPEKNQASIILMGMTIGFLPFALLTAVPLILGTKPILNSQVSYLSISAIPATCYYVIVNKYLPDSRCLFRTAITFISTGVISSIVVTLLLFFSKSVRVINSEVYLISLCLTMLFMLCSSYVRIILNRLFNTFISFEGDKNDKKRLLKLNQDLILINEEHRLLEQVAKSLKVEGAFIVIKDDKGGYVNKAAGIFLEKPSEYIKLEEFFHTSQTINLEANILPNNFPAELYIPFVCNGFTCGIFIGHRHSRVKFGLDELPLITLIANQLAQHLITTFVINKLSKEIKDLAQRARDSQLRSQGLQGVTTTLFRSIEKEKKRIAREIHDGPLQLGMDLDRRLKTLVEEDLVNEKTFKGISHIQELVVDLSFELRLICNDLRPPSLSDLGWLPAIELLCEEIMFNELLLISLETVGISREERFNEEVELAAYRFVQEGISNAVKHSGSSKLNIHIERNKSRIELTIRDWGKGFNTSKIDDWSLTGVHFGIVGMKERLESLNGNFKISSKIGGGTILKATIPILKD